MLNKWTSLLFATAVIVVLVSTTTVAQEVVQGAGTAIEGVDKRVSPLQSLDSETLNSDAADIAVGHRSNTSASKWGPERNSAVPITCKPDSAGSTTDSHPAKKWGGMDLSGREMAIGQPAISGLGKSAVAHKQINPSAAAQEVPSSPFKHPPFSTRPTAFLSGKAIPSYGVRTHAARREKPKQSQSSTKKAPRRLDANGQSSGLYRSAATQRKAAKATQTSGSFTLASSTP